LARRPLGPLGVRFALAFVAVSLFAVAVFSAAILIADQGNVSHLAGAERDRTAAEVAALADSAYRSGAGWTDADMASLETFADQAGVAVEVRDQTGRAVASANTAALSGPDRPVVAERTLTVHDQTVGTATITFPAGGVNPADRHLRASLFSAVAWSAGLAALGALLVGVLTARSVVRPLRRLAAAVGSLKLGGSAPRIGPAAGPGELGELGRAFDLMADSLEHEDRLRRALVADVAHELRTPVAVMQAETEALADGITAPTGQALASLHEEAVRLGRLVEDLQTLASAQAAGLELDRRPFDLGRLAADAASSLLPQFRDARIDLEQDLPPTPAVGDSRRIRQVAVNLLTNAAKFTPAGGQVELRTFVAGDQAVLEVSDSGPGVSPAERHAVWERFYRGSAATIGTGSGIGLAVVKALVDAHHGSVDVEDRPGGGARFTVSVPTSTSARPSGTDAGR
jgi:two-component system, OmpR family, sensor histidine kinase BaeS